MKKLQHPHKDDIELATTSIDTPRLNTSIRSIDDTSHYTIAKRMVNYQSVDFGNHCELLQSSAR